MRNINECYAGLALHLLQLYLHILAQLEVKSAERLIEKEQARTVYECACYCHALLLTAREIGHFACLKALEIYERQHTFYFCAYVGVRHFFKTQTEGDIFVDVEVREERIALENGIDLSFVRR